MKKLFCIALVACTFQTAHAQTTATEAPHAALSKTDDTILLELKGTPETGWRQLAQVLMQRGYSIEHSDKELLTLSTHPLVGQNAYPIRVTGMVVEQTLLLRMYLLNTPPSSSIVGAMPVRGRTGISEEWKELEAIARELGGSVRYTASTSSIIYKQ